MKRENETLSTTEVLEVGWNGNQLLAWRGDMASSWMTVGGELRLAASTLQNKLPSMSPAGNLL